MPKKKTTEKLDFGRIYPTPWGPRISVTSLIEITQTTREKAALQKWRQKQEERGLPTSSSEGQVRGAMVHRMREVYLTEKMHGRDPNDLTRICEKADFNSLPEGMMEEVLEHYHRLLPYYQKYDFLYWIEGPSVEMLKSNPELMKYFWIENGQRKAYLFHKDHIWAGCPDDVVQINGENYLIDLKTSKRLYFRGPSTKPYPGIFNEARKAEAEGKWDTPAQIQLRTYKEQQSGYYSFKKVCLQLLAYKPLVEKCLDIEIHKLATIVAAPERVQFFVLTPGEMRTYKQAWDEKVQAFEEKYFEYFSREPCK